MAKSVRLNRTTRNGIQRNVHRAIENKYKSTEPMKSLEDTYKDAVLVDLAVYTKEMVAIAKEQGIEEYLDFSHSPDYTESAHKIRIGTEYFSYFIPGEDQYLRSNGVYLRYTDGTDFHAKFSKKWAIVGKLRRDNAAEEERVRNNKNYDIYTKACSIISAANTTAQLEAAFEGIAEHYPWEIRNALS